MDRFRFAIGLASLLSTMLLGTPAQAFFHAWQFSEFYSSPDGSVQFIELRSNASGETEAGGATITSMSTGNVFTFPADLVGSTLNNNLLITTANFGALPGGIAPDYDDLPPNFFNPAGDRLTLFQFETIDSKQFAFVPNDGLISRHYPSNMLAINSPMNFARASGSIDESVPEPASILFAVIAAGFLAMRRRTWRAY